jgi:hypothetical protein
MGRLVRDPEMRESKKSGRLFCSMRVAVDGGYRGYKMDKKTTFFSVLAFGDKGRKMHNHLRKGQRCIFFGTLDCYERVDIYGNKQEVYCIVAYQYEPIDYREIKEPIEDITDADGKLIIPKEITDHLVKQIDATDEDVPDDFAERRIDDFLPGR